MMKIKSASDINYLNLEISAELNEFIKKSAERNNRSKRKEAIHILSQYFLSEREEKLHFHSHTQ